MKRTPAANQVLASTQGDKAVAAEEQATWTQLLESWQAVMGELPIATRSKWRGGKWVAVRDGKALFAVPNEWHKRACQQTLEAVQGLLWVNWPNDPEPKIELVVHPDVNAKDIAVVDDESVVKAALGETIQAARKKVGLSQRELGRRIEMDQSAISGWERGSAIPSIDRLFRLDLAFGLQPGTLLVRAGLVRPEAIETAARRSQADRPADVTRVEVTSPRGKTATSLPARLSVEQWLELVRTMIGSDNGAADVTEVTVASSGGVESSIQMPEGQRSLEELLRLVEIMLEAQGEFEPPRPISAEPPVAYDPSEEPF